MPVSVSGTGPVAGVTTLNGLTIPATSFGKVLQVIRAIDTTERTTTSTTAVDANLNVTITPQLNTSAILLICSFYAQTSGSGVYPSFLLTNSSNATVSGAERTQVGVSAGGVWLGGQTLIGYSTPATTSTITYKLRWFVNTGTGTLANATNTAQLFAIEVAS